MADEENRAFRAAHLIDAAARCERKARECLDEAKRYREMANRILGGTAATPEPR